MATGLVYVNNSGTWTPAKQIFVNQSGTWTPVKRIWVNQSGTWTQVYPAASGSQTYSTPGTFIFTVPDGIYTLSVTTVGGGGGGGGSVFSGDGHGAANGGSGGYYQNQTLSVTPGLSVVVNVGAGGVGGTSNYTGGTGNSSSITYNGTTYFTATGGSGGTGVYGDNAPAPGGAGGSPNGVAGSYTASWMVNRNTAGQGYNGGGINALGVGNGGLGGNVNGPGTAAGYAGGNGEVIISWSN